MSEYRYEIKFSLDDANYSRAMQWLFVNTHATKRFDNRYVNSLYFDNPGYSAIRDNITGLSERSKYRLRWYNEGITPNSAISPRFEVKIRKKLHLYRTLNIIFYYFHFIKLSQLFELN